MIYDYIHFALRMMAGFSPLIVICIAITFANATAIEEPKQTWKEQLRDRAAEWNIQTAINDTLSAAERFNNYSSHHADNITNNDYCVWDDYGNGTQYLEYCLVGSEIIQCHNSTDERARCEEYDKIIDREVSIED